MLKNESFPVYSAPALAPSEYHDFYRFSPIGLLVLSNEACIWEANLVATQLLGVEHSELLGSYLYDFVSPPDQNTYHTFLQNLSVANMAQSCEIQLISANRENIFTQINGVMINRDGEMFYSIVISNITEKKEEEQQKYEKAIEQQRIQVLASFINDTSHDLRTPLTKIVTGLYLVERTHDSDLRQKKIAEISKEVFSLTRLLEQLQEMAVLDSLPKLEFQPRLITTVLMNLIKETRTDLEAKKITLLKDFQENLPPIPLDIDRIFLALLNLVNNAIQFTPSGGLVSLRAYQEGHYINIEVADNGIGITSEMLPHIFKRFFKGDTARSVHTGGSGLGLSLVHRIVELHSGVLWVNSLPNVETLFQIRLPLSS